MQTQQLISYHLPIVIADLVIKFITPRSGRPKHIFEAGCLEMLNCDQYCKGTILKYAIRYRIIHIAKLIIEQPLMSTDLTAGLEGACRIGNIQLATYFIDYGGSITPCCWMVACRSGSITIVELIATKRSISKFLVNKGLGEACRSGSMELVNWIIEYGANDWSIGLAGACRGNRAEIAIMMANRDVVDYSNALYNCVLYGYVDLADAIITIANKSPFKKFLYRRDGVSIIIKDFIDPQSRIAIIAI